MKADKMFDTVESNKKDTTMFEVNDKGRENEITGDRYKKPFVDFIESLGYEVEYPDMYFSKVKINGIDFWM